MVNVREVRKRMGLTQTQLAEMLGISRGRLSNIETRVKSGGGMRSDVAFKLAPIFGVSFEDFYSREDVTDRVLDSLR